MSHIGREIRKGIDRYRDGRGGREGKQKDKSNDEEAEAFSENTLP